MTLITKHALRPLWSLIGPLIGPDLVLQVPLYLDCWRLGTWGFPTSPAPAACRDYCRVKAAGARTKSKEKFIPAIGLPYRWCQWRSASTRKNKREADTEITVISSQHNILQRQR